MFRNASACIFFCWIAVLSTVSARAQDKRVDEELSSAWNAFASAPAGLDSELYLIAVFEMWDQAGPKKIMRLLERAERLSGASIRARERARYLLALTKLRLGDIEGAKESFDERGFLRDWLVAGPFDNEGGTGFDTLYSPEHAANAGFDLKASMAGKERDVLWRAAPKRSSHMGYNHLESLFEPGVNSCVFALSTIVSEKPGLAILRIGAGGAFKAYWNGIDAFDDRSYRGPDPDRSAAKVKIEKGLNRLLIKICNQEDRHLGFYARLTDSRANPWPIEPSADQGGAAAVAVKKGQAASRLSQPLDLLTERAAKNPGNAAASAAAARFLSSTGAVDKSSHEARNLARFACNSKPGAENCLLWSKLALDRNEQRLAVERARAVEPDSIDALLAMARIEARGPSPVRANRFIDKALSLKPGDLRARMLKFEVQALLGFEQTAYAAAKELLEKNPDVPLAVETAAGLAERAGDARNALALDELSLKLKFDNVYKHELSAKTALARRDMAAFERGIKAVDDLKPFDPEACKFRSELLIGAGQLQSAEQALRDRIGIASEDADAWKDLAMFLLLHDREREGLSAMETAANLRPQDAWIADYLAHLSPKPRFEDPFVVPPEIFLSERGRKQGGENERLLVDQTVVRVFESGLSSRFRQIVAEVKTREGIRNWRRWWIQFSPADQRVALRQARVFRKDGKVENSVSSGIVAVSEPWYRLYYDIEAEVLEMPPLVPGDVVEISYRIDDVARRNVFNDYFGDFVFIEENAPKDLWRYALIAPSTRSFNFNSPEYARLTRKKEKKGDVVEEIFEARGVEAVKPEHGMPGPTSAAAYVHVSTYGSWKELGDWYRNLIRDQLIPDARMREKVSELVKGAKSELDKVKAIYGWVVSATRYIGLEFGIHGYKPYRAPLVVSRGFGDCKDKAGLLVSMLREAGVEAEFALVRTNDLGDIEEYPSSLAVFNHAIAYVPGLDLWLDGTAEQFGPLELPFGDQGAAALRIRRDDAIFVHTPIMPAERNATEVSVEILLDPDGDANISARASVGGETAAGLRRQMEAAQTRRERFEAMLAQTFPGARLGELEFESIEELGAPVAYNYTAFVPAFGKATENAVQVPIDVGLGLLESYGRIGKREQDLITGALFVSSRKAVLKIPASFDVKRLPPSAVVESKFGRLSIRIDRIADAISVTRRFELMAHRVSKQDYAEFLDFCRRVDDALKERIYLERVR